MGTDQNRFDKDGNPKKININPHAFIYVMKRPERHIMLDFDKLIF